MIQTYRRPASARENKRNVSSNIDGVLLGIASACMQQAAATAAMHFSFPSALLRSLSISLSFSVSISSSSGSSNPSVHMWNYTMCVLCVYAAMILAGAIFDLLYCCGAYCSTSRAYVCVTWSPCMLLLRKRCALCGVGPRLQQPHAHQRSVSVSVYIVHRHAVAMRQCNGIYIFA